MEDFHFGRDVLSRNRNATGACPRLFCFVFENIGAMRLSSNYRCFRNGVIRSVSVFSTEKLGNARGEVLKFLAGLVGRDALNHYYKCTAQPATRPAENRNYVMHALSRGRSNPRTSSARQTARPTATSGASAPPPFPPSPPGGPSALPKSSSMSSRERPFVSG